MKDATEARASRRVTILARLPPASSDVSKGKGVAVTETVGASQIVAVRVVAVASDSERAAGRKRDPRPPMPSTEKWRTTGSRLVTKTKVSH